MLHRYSNDNGKMKIFRHPNIPPVDTHINRAPSSIGMRVDEFDSTVTYVHEPLFVNTYMQRICFCLHYKTRSTRKPPPPNSHLKPPDAISNDPSNSSCHQGVTVDLKSAKSDFLQRSCLLLLPPACCTAAHLHIRKLGH